MFTCMRYFFSLIIKGTQSIIDQDNVFHIISPGSSLSAPGSNRNLLLLAHALALEADLRLFSMLEEDKDLKVIFLMVLTAWRQSHRQKNDQTNRLDHEGYNG